MVVREAQQGYGASIPWSPIEPLDMDSIDMDFREINGLHRQWLEVRASVEESTPKAYDQFNEELFRSWAIETGIIEGLYDLDRGVTLTLIQQGFSGDIIDETILQRPTERSCRNLAGTQRLDRLREWLDRGVSTAHQVLHPESPPGHNLDANDLSGYQHAWSVVRCRVAQRGVQATSKQPDAP